MLHVTPTSMHYVRDMHITLSVTKSYVEKHDNKVYYV